MAGIEQQRAGVDWFSLRTRRSEDSETYINTNVVPQRAMYIPSFCSSPCHIHAYLHYMNSPSNRCTVSQQHSVYCCMCIYIYEYIYIYSGLLSLIIFNNMSFGKRNVRENCWTRDELLAMINECYKREN